MNIIILLSLLCTGIYYEYQACILSIVLIGALTYVIKNKGELVIKKSYPFFFFLTLIVFYLLTVIWAVDSHMAFWGFLKFLPLLLFAVYLMQIDVKREQLMDIFPIAGVLMTVISVAGSYIPVLQEYFKVNGRLAGTFQYPNTFALFLLVSLLYLLCHKDLNLKNGILAILLAAGILLSGSRTVYLIMPISLLAAVFLIKEKKKKYMIVLGMILIAVAGLAMIIQGNGTPVERILEVSLSESTLLGRVLYWKDAIPVILKNPFGMGYMGYYFTQGSFQTGVYSVNHVHNEFLQVFLDVGWIPGLGFCGLFGYGLRKAKFGWQRLLIAVMMAHCFMDFDLQYIAVYMVLMLLLPWDGGTQSIIKSGKAVSVASAAAAVLMIYFAVGNSAFYFDNHALAKKVYPQNTFLQIEELTRIQDADRLNSKVNEILENNESVSLAWSAKARVDLSRGDVRSMMEDKNRAIALSKYTIEEYEDYLQMLLAAAQLYHQGGDFESEQYCMEEAQRIPQMLKTVEKETDPLAWKLDDKPELELHKAVRGLM